jgi:hypothetical protein
MDSTEDSKSFFKHVFNFDDEAKADILNIIQYTLIALIPIVILNKLLQKYIPEANDKKGNIEISAEIIFQLLIMFLGLLLIHRIITYIPTYSGSKYPEFNIIFIVLALLMITLSLQTKLGEKVSILVDRLNELWNGKTEEKTNKKNNVKVSQPISGNNNQVQSQNIVNDYTNGTAISSLPTYDMAQGNQNTMTPQTLPNYDTMYKQDNNPLINASSPSMEGFNEPMAANLALGGGW